MSECDPISGYNWKYLNILLKDGLQMDRYLLKTSDRLLNTFEERGIDQPCYQGINNINDITLK